jgi:DNA repair protein RAD16
VEYAKSARAACKKCESKIAKGDIRVGVMMEGEWGMFTRWQHLNCTVFAKRVSSAEEVSGYADLDEDDIASLEKRITETANEKDMEMIALDPDEIVRAEWTESVEPPDELLMPLLNYQKEGLAWMLHQEKSDFHGGILADEVGISLGLLSSISRCCAHRWGWERRFNASDSSLQIVQKIFQRQRGRLRTSVTTSPRRYRSAGEHW